MFYFNLLVILLVHFHVHFWFLYSKRSHLKSSSEKKGTLTENYGGAGAPSALCSGGRVMQVKCHVSNKKRSYLISPSSEGELTGKILASYIKILKQTFCYTF